MKLTLLCTFLFFSVHFAFGQEEVSPEIIELEKKVKSAKGKEQVDLLNKLAWKYRNSNLKKSLQSINKALKKAKKLKYDKGLAQGLNFAGVIHRKLGNYDKATSYFFECLEVAEKSKNNIEKAYAFINMSEIYLYQMDYKNAESYIRKSSKIFAKLDNKEGLAYGQLRLAEAYEAQGQKDEALEHFFEAVKLREKLNDKRGLAVAYAGIGRVYFSQNKPKIALNYITKAITLYPEDDKSGIAQSQRQIAEVYLKTNELEKAEEYAKASLDLGNSFNSKKIVQEASLLLSKIYTKNGKFKEAIQLQEKALALKDSLFAEETTRSINNLRESYEAEKKQSQIDNLEKYHAIEKQENRVKTTLLYVSLIAIVLISLSLGLLYRNFLINKKITKQIKYKNTQISSIADDLKKANRTIALKNKNITSSINYAKKIQQAIFPSKREMEKVFSDYFVFHKPKDIVSGDFYWVFEQGYKTFVVVGDCTGHGIPGAFMSVIGNDLLNYIVVSQGVQDANRILDELRSLVHHVLHQYESENRDGMDIGLCVIDREGEEMKLEFAGAAHSLYYFDNEGFKEIRGSKLIIGGFSFLQKNESFAKHEIVLKNYNKPYMFYLASDGFQDQFNKKGKKFMKKRFRQTLQDIHKEDMKTQRRLLSQKFEDWREESFQVDDVLVLGFKVN